MPDAQYHEVYFLNPSYDTRHVFHRVQYDGVAWSCVLNSCGNGVSGSPYSFNLAPNHPYVIKHHRTLDGRCVLEITQGPAVNLPDGCCSTASGQAAAAEPKSVLLQPPTCSYNNITIHCNDPEGTHAVPDGEGVRCAPNLGDPPNPDSAKRQ